MINCDVCYFLTREGDLLPTMTLRPYSYLQKATFLTGK